tara:strand:- start:949 stop:1200 length:252 start_codon:yes stop_codon:yes gene_type:complete
MGQRGAVRLSISRLDSAGVGDSDGPVSQRAEGPFWIGQGDGVLARRTAGKGQRRRNNDSNLILLEVMNSNIIASSTIITNEYY